MNAKILIAAVLGGFLFFGNNKSKSKSSTTPVKEDEIIEEEDTEVEKEEKPSKPKTPTYNTLTPARKKIIDEYLTTMPLYTSEFGPFNDYNEWSAIQKAANIKPLYQNYLATNIYHNISKLEGKTDVFTELGEANPPGYDGSLPYLLQRGKKAIISKGGPWVEIFDFGESTTEANKRLGKGIALWSDIKKYIDNNIDLEICSAGAVCE